MKPKVYTKDQHGIDKTKIDSDALFVLETLHNAGFLAYLVGGGVRDLLRGETPKDYDISTSARPEQIKPLFQRCLLIGRRFRLAHVRFGQKIIEVSTFRAGSNEKDSLIVRDNTFGTPEQDVLRRDFTINGLFYDANEETVIDYLSGYQDIGKQCLRCIGTPENRFKQDPVRMLRLLKFHARFGYSIDPEAMAALNSCKREIMKSSEARILEEFLRMLESGASENFILLLQEHGFMQLLWPALTHFLEGEHSGSILALLRAADKERDNTPFSRTVLFTCLLFPILEQELETQYLSQGQTPNLGQIQQLAEDLIEGVLLTSFCPLPKRMRSLVIYTLTAQYRLIPLKARNYNRTRTAAAEDFAEAYHFLRLRALVDPALEEAYQSWLPYQPKESSSPRKRRKRSPRKYNRRRRK